MVLPDLETPGNMATAWKSPISKAPIQPNFSKPFCPFSKNLVTAKIKAVNKNVNTNKFKESKAPSIFSLNKNPTKTAGIVAKIIKPISL